MLRPAPFFTCHGRCSYDECFDDSACPALTPCECRISETVAAANRCVTGSNCRVDTDACGHGYYCHTKLDDCLDDADCGTKGTCNYDQLESRWTCGVCWPIV